MYQVCDITPQIRDIKVLKSQYLVVYSYWDIYEGKKKPMKKL